MKALLQMGFSWCFIRTVSSYFTCFPGECQKKYLVLSLTIRTADATLLYLCGSFRLFPSLCAGFLARDPLQLRH